VTTAAEARGGVAALLGQYREVAVCEWSADICRTVGKEDNVQDSGGYEAPVLVELGGFFALTSAPSGSCVDGFGGYNP